MFTSLFPSYLARNLSILRTAIRHHCKVPAIVMNNGNEMPIIGLGTCFNDLTKATKAVGWAIEAGYRHIDCAHLYENQHEIGQVLKKKIESNILSREKLFVTGKLWNTFHSPDSVLAACKQTLEELQLDYLDMYLMHTPMGFQHSNKMFPMLDGKLLYSNEDYIDTWGAMEDLVAKNMCRNIGISNFNMQQIKRLLQHCNIKPQTLQIEIHPYMAQKQLVQFAKSNDICITAYAAIGSPGRAWGNAVEPRTLLTDYKILEIAEKHNCTVAQILLRFQIQSGHATIPNAETRDHILENINIFEFELSPEDVRNIESLDHNLRYFQFSKTCGHPHYPFKNTEEANT